MLIKQEIFSVGRWNGMDFTIEDLRVMKSSFDTLKDVFQIPLKLGHDEEQPLTDGLPAFGWVTNVMLNETKSPPKLEAEFEIESPVVMKAIEMGLYKNVSVEIDIGVTYKKERFEFVLTGVALLGAELPAVNNLNDLGKFFTKSDATHAEFSVDKHLAFTFNDKGDFDMDEVKKLQEQMAEMNAKFTKVSEASDVVSKENEELKKANDEQEKKIIEFTKAQEEALYSEKKTKVEQTLETLVKAKAMTPAAREQFTKDITEDNIDTKTEVAEVLASTLNINLDDSETGMQKKFGADESTESPDKLICAKAEELMLANPKLLYSTATEQAHKLLPEASKAWAAMDGYDGGNH